MSKINVFVYGTLKNGSRVKDIVEGALMVNVGSFPAIHLNGKKDDKIEVEIAEIDEKTLEDWDRYEGIPRLYTREEVITVSGVKGYIYEGNIAYQSAKNNVIKPDEDGIARWKGRKRGEYFG